MHRCARFVRIYRLFRALAQEIADFRRAEFDAVENVLCRDRQNRVEEKRRDGDDKTECRRVHGDSNTSRQFFLAFVGGGVFEGGE